MFDNIHLYIIIGILGSISPILDKLNLENVEWSTFLFVREIIFLFFFGLLVLINKKTNFSKLTNLNQKQKGLILLGSIVSVIYVCLIFKTFSLEFKSQAISKVVTVMVVTTMIFTFLVDKFYFEASFSNENYLGLILLFLGIYLLKLE
jgi:uncharacterized membrane protein